MMQPLMARAHIRQGDMTLPALYCVYLRLRIRLRILYR